MDTEVRRFAVFGNPIKHSLSPEIHRLFAEQCGLSIDYQKIESAIDGNDFEQDALRFFESGGLGANVTLPFKLRAFQLAQGNSYDNSQEDKVIGTAHQDSLGSEAANTLYISPSITKKENIPSRIIAANTDSSGLLKDIRDNLGWDINKGNILIWGAGGAARSILPALLAANPQNIFVYNRTETRTRDLIKHYQSVYNSKVAKYLKGIKTDELPQLSTIEKNFTLVINATSLGLSPEEDTFFAQFAPILHPEIYCYDLVYKKDGDTDFIGWARKNGVKPENLADGLGMLVEQAALSFRIWNGSEYLPQTREVIDLIRETHPMAAESNIKGGKC